MTQSMFERISILLRGMDLSDHVTFLVDLRDIYPTGILSSWLK